MGLDGISINQLRIGSELSSGNLNKLNSEANPQFIDALTKSQRINPDEKKEQQSKNKNARALEQENQEEQEEDSAQTKTQDEVEQLNDNEIEKYDLSDSKKYILKVDEKTNEILIIEKATQKIIQTFNPESLSNLTRFVSNYTGVLINRKY